VRLGQGDASYRFIISSALVDSLAAISSNRGADRKRNSGKARRESARSALKARRGRPTAHTRRSNERETAKRHADEEGEGGVMEGGRRGERRSITAGQRHSPLRHQRIGAIASSA